MTRIDTVDQLDALPIGSVCVDPYDEKGDAPVVICKNARGLWQALGGEEAGPVLTPDFVAQVSKGRLIAVYVPGRDLVQEAKADAWDECSRTAHPTRTETRPCDWIRAVAGRRPLRCSTSPARRRRPWPRATSAASRRPARRQAASRSRRPDDGAKPTGVDERKSRGPRARARSSRADLTMTTTPPRPRRADDMAGSRSCEACSGIGRLAERRCPVCLGAGKVPTGGRPGRKAQARAQAHARVVARSSRDAAYRASLGVAPGSDLPKSVGQTEGHGGPQKVRRRR